MIKIVTVVGARPQFIKAAALSRIIINDFNNEVSEVIVHTGQHFDENMSDVFFNELGIPRPKYNLEISGGTHGKMTSRMLGSIEEILLEERPNWVLIYGDTNSTLAAALAAVKLNIPIAHIEAGLRSFNMRMPEEVNRILSDRISSLLFCPTVLSINHLKNEGIEAGVHLVGDVMYDVSLFYSEQAHTKSKILNDLDINEKSYVLATCHRAENTDDMNKLKEILTAINKISKEIPVVFPLHPRTRKIIEENNFFHYLESVKVTEPLPFLDMVRLEQCASSILTDSGGVQKEAFFYKVPCVTMRDETEWVETVDLGWNILTGADSNRIYNACMNGGYEKRHGGNPYGDGNAAKKCISILLGENKKI